MKHRKILYAMLLACLTACQDDLGVNDHTEGGEYLNLSVGMSDGYLKSRAEGQPAFQKGTLLHVYGTKANGDSEEWGINYLHASATDATMAKGMSGETKGGTNAQRIERTDDDDKIATVFREKPLNLYGVTVVDKDADITMDADVIAEQVKDNNKLLEEYYTEAGGSSNVPPQYKVWHKAETTAEGEASQNYLPLSDVMWSGSLKNQTPHDNAGDIILPFTHTLSKLNFYAVLADGCTVTDIKIKSLSLTDYADGVLNMANGLYKRTDGNAARTVVVDVTDDFATNPVVVTSDVAEGSPFATSLIFPTTGVGYANTSEMEVASSDAVKITLSIDNGTESGKTFSNIELKYNGKLQAFHPNYEYDVIFTLTTNSVVVTLVPKYFDYITEDLTLGQYEVGEPTDFGGMLWAAANLGATSVHPTANALEWEKSRGFYYQFGRNIPYYARGSVQDPYPGVATYTTLAQYEKLTDKAKWYNEYSRTLYANETYNPLTNPYIPYSKEGASLKEAFEHSARPYPYIPSLWEKSGYSNFLINYVGICEKTGYPGASLSVETDPHAALTNTNAKSFAFAAFSSADYYRDWDRSHSLSGNNWGIYRNQPCPKGWRLPSAHEFLSVFPVDALAGDISFNEVGGTGADNGDEDGDDNLKGRYAAGFYEWTSESDYNRTPAKYVGIYQDGQGNNRLPSIESDGKIVQQGWGTLYALKCIGTDEAYIVRWQVKIIDDNNIDAATGKTVNPPHTHATVGKVGRAVLVVSKYNLGKDKSKVKLAVVKIGNISTIPTTVASHICVPYIDKAGGTANVYDEDLEEKITLEWDRPSGEIYFPITGYFITTWRGDGQGLIYAGSECLYWTSTAMEYKGGYYGVSARMKYAGSYEDRYLYMAPHDMRGYGANIRCVRDTKVDL